MIFCSPEPFPQIQKLKEAVMKQLRICAIVGLVCLSLISVVAGKQDPNNKKTPDGNLPSEVCLGIQQYIADVEAAKSMKDVSARKTQYSAAEQRLAEILKRNGKMRLLKEITEYAHYSEMAAAAGSRDPNLTKILADQLKTRTKLLEWCMSDSSRL